MFFRCLAFLCGFLFIPSFACADSSLGRLDINLMDLSLYTKAQSLNDFDIYILKPSIKADVRQATGTKGLSVFIIHDYGNNYTQDTSIDIHGSKKKSGIFYNRAVIETSINCFSKEFTSHRTALLRDGEIISDKSSSIYWNKTSPGNPYTKVIDLVCSLGFKYL